MCLYTLISPPCINQRIQFTNPKPNTTSKETQEANYKSSKETYNQKMSLLIRSQIKPSIDKNQVVA